MKTLVTFSGLLTEVDFSVLLAVGFRTSVWTGCNGPVQGDSGFTGFMCQGLRCGVEVAQETQTPKTDLQQVRRLFWHFKWNTSVSDPRRPR